MASRKSSSSSISDGSLDLPDDSFKSAKSSEGEEEDQHTQSLSLNRQEDEKGASGGGFISDDQGSTTDEEEHSDTDGDDELFETSHPAGHSIIEGDGDDDDSNIEDDASIGHSIMVPETPPGPGDNSNEMNTEKVSESLNITGVVMPTPSSTSIDEQLATLSIGTKKERKKNVDPLSVKSQRDSGNGSDPKVVELSNCNSGTMPVRLPAVAKHSIPSHSPISGLQDTVKDLPSRQLFTQKYTFKEKRTTPASGVEAEHIHSTASSLYHPFSSLAPTSLNPPLTKKMSTSTPLLSNRKQMNNVFEELDVTSIGAAEDVNRLNLTGNDKETIDLCDSNCNAATEVINLSPSISGTPHRPSNPRRGSANGDDSDDVVVFSEDDEDTDNMAHGRHRKNSPQNKDIDEITARFKKQHIEKKPLVQFLEEPLPMLPNPFASSKPRQNNNTWMSLAKIDDAKTDVFKLAKLLMEIIQDMPHADDDHSDFLPPKQLKIGLYPHQIFGSKWLCWRERQYPGGGILADEMGLGKTIMAITLILNGKNAAREDTENWFTPQNKKLVPSRATLVVCPVGCIGQWEKELKTKAKGLQVLMFHGPSRIKSAALLSQNDVVLTTYPTLASEISKPDDDPHNKCQSPLFRIHWERIILDEGHIIRNPKTHGALSACRISANHRWIVTGTPVHNKPEDFYSLVKFLQLSPFDDVKVWQHWIGTKAVLKGCEERLHTIGKALILRRTKEEISSMSPDAGKILPKYVEEIEVTLSESENAVYTYLFDYAKSVMRQFLEAQKNRQDELQNAANNYVAGAMRRGRKNNEKDRRFSDILCLCVRLRQLAVLPFLIKTMLDEDDVDDSDCDTSYDPFDDPINAKNPVFEPGFKSAKIRAVLEELRKLKLDAEDKGQPMDKVIIISQWTSFLDIMGQHLRKKGFSYSSLDGRLQIQERTEVMDTFNSNPKRPQVLLLSITAGGVGLNLTGANHVFFIEPQWNPQIERQAQDRVHRFGQTKPVYIKRFICQSSFEQRVMQIQNTKMELADNLLNNAKKTRSVGLNVNDLKKLFDLA